MTFDKFAVDRFDGGRGLSREHGDDHLKLMIDELASRWAHWQKDAADGAAGTATAEVPYLHALSYSKTVKAVKYVPGAALTADNANYATLRVRKRKADGSDGGIVAQVTTQITGSGNWVAFRAVTVPLVGASSVLLLAAGESLTMEIIKTGTGVVVPVGCLRTQLV